MKTRQSLIRVVPLALVLACGQDGGSNGPPSAPIAVSPGAAETITASEMLQHVAIFASDELAGRDTPSPGLEIAAEYLADEFEAAGLQPAGDDGTYVQRFPLPPPGGASAPNVVGLLPGSDPVLRETFVVLTAHFDHLGVGPPDFTGDTVFNGADDNASGTAALIEIAEAFASLDRAPFRSIIFLGVSGEEKGLWGSLYYAANPTVPIESIVANLNADMIARNRPDLLAVIGHEYSTLGPLVRQVARQHPELGLTLTGDPNPEARIFFRSDQLSFVLRDIPALFFHSGAHVDYHQRTDEVQRFDPDKAARAAGLIFYTAEAIANDPQPPEWTSPIPGLDAAIEAHGRGEFQHTH